MKYLATIVYEIAPALGIILAFKHGCLAINHSAVNIIIMCYLCACLETSHIQVKGKGVHTKEAGLRWLLAVIHMLVVLIKAHTLIFCAQVDLGRRNGMHSFYVACVTMHTQKMP